MCAFLRPVLLLIVSGISASHIACDESTTTPQTTAEPPFPHLFDPILDGQLTSVKIVSESMGTNAGFETNTEYLDLSLARAAYQTRNKVEQKVILLDAIRNKSFSYKPYTCDVHSQRDLTVPGPKGWSTDVSLAVRVTSSDEEEGNSADTTQVNLRLFGVVGLWLFASQRPKVYSSSAVVYSVSKNIYRVSHRWTVEDIDNKMRIELHFIDTSSKESKQPSLSLEMVQLIELEGEQKVVATYNILSVDYDIDEDAYNSVLQVPVGYGCLDDIEETEFDDKRQKSGQSIQPLFVLNRRKLSLEATATKFTNSTRESSTINIELARIAKIYLMVRIRDTRFDYKHVIDSSSNVQYTIDSRRGSCKLEHYPTLNDEDDLCKFDIDFANQMTLKVSFELLIDLFDERKNFKLVKTTKRGPIDTKYVYFERTSIGLLGGTRPTRVIRKFVLDEDEYSLESVTLWTLSEDETRLEEMYYLNVVDFEPIDHIWPSISHVFDVSEECYINNNKMQNGRDYAWLEFTYPLASQESAALASYNDYLKNVLYRRYSSYLRWSRFRIPRVELEFDDDSFVLRLLALNNPPIEVMFEKKESSALIFNANSDQRGYVPDMGHCAELCRKQHCHAISYCESTHSCIFTGRQISASTDTVNNAQCDTYYDLRPDQTYVNTLQHVISKNQHIDYSPLAVPKPPEELLLPESESGVDSSTYSELLDSYVKELMIYLKRERPGLDGISFVSKLNGLLTVLIPNGFDVEVDPLSEFDLTDSSAQDNDDVDRLPAFHEGLSMFRYKPEAFDQAQQRNARLFNGLTYDQCALACTDSKCGSFSYCPSRSECFITTVNSTSVAQSNNLIEQDTDCFIMQRDFLRNFAVFENVYRPQMSKKKSAAASPSECALACVSENSFRCLAFDYCEEKSAIQGKPSKKTCFYQATRHQTNIESVPTKTKTPVPGAERTGCTHYSRSFLADFIHIEYRAIDEKVKAQLRSSKFTGKSVFDCASMCVTEVSDCSAFEFCFDPTQSQQALQSCELVQGRLSQSKLADLSAIVDESSDDKLVDAGKLLVSSPKCHVYSMRHDSTEAQLRDLAISAETLHDKTEARRLVANRGGSLAFGRGLLLFVTVALVSGAIGSGICIAKSNEQVRQKFERARLLLRS